MKSRTYIWLLTGLVLSGMLWTTEYIERTRVYDLDEMMAFLATCGDLIQADFQSTRPDQLDYFIVLVSGAVVLYCLFFSIKYMTNPESKGDHIKYQILEDEKKHQNLPG